MRNCSRFDVANSGVQRAMGSRRLLVFHLLQIVRENDGCDPTLGNCNADGPVDEMTDLRRGGSLLYEGARDILVQARQIQLLLIVPSACIASLLPRVGENRHVIEAGVVETCYEM